MQALKAMSFSFPMWGWKHFCKESLYTFEHSLLKNVFKIPLVLKFYKECVLACIIFLTRVKEWFKVKSNILPHLCLSHPWHKCYGSGKQLNCYLRIDNCIANGGNLY